MIDSHPLTDDALPTSAVPSQGYPESRAKPSDTVHQIAQAFRISLSNGEIASLRRLSPQDPAHPAFFRLAARFLEPAGHLPSDGPWRDLAERRWACVVNGLALLGDLHRPGASLGEALAESGFSELRFVRLLRAQDAALWDAIRSVARFLISKGQPADWSDPALLVFSDGADWAESIRRRIARRYYATLSKKQEGDNPK